VTSLLVIGNGGVGQAVTKAAPDDWDVLTADLEGKAELAIDLENPANVVACFKNHHFTHVVVAAGLNLETSLSSMGLHRQTQHMMAVNFLGPMVAMQAWLRGRNQQGGHFVVVGSNSAHIPRTGSLGYCASKAALHMGIRVAAREAADYAGPVTIWGVDPGWVEDTGMSRSVMRRAEQRGWDKLHRIPGDRTLTAEDVARVIITNIRDNALYLNGCMLRIDGGEI
jgi:meso-butanediol dehydrogenase / (S,S)-butanediol dehydrogenase / diacetyl reductase